MIARHADSAACLLPVLTCCEVQVGNDSAYPRIKPVVGLIGFSFQ